jgi:hypothetical protein
MQYGIYMQNSRWGHPADMRQGPFKYPEEAIQACYAATSGGLQNMSLKTIRECREHDISVLKAGGPIDCVWWVIAAIDESKGN